MKRLYLVTTKGGFILGYSGQRKGAIGLAERILTRKSGTSKGETSGLKVVKAQLTTIKEVEAPKR